jgi:hypothetical protein
LDHTRHIDDEGGGQQIDCRAADYLVGLHVD